MRGNLARIMVCVAVGVSCSGCHYYKEYRVLTSKADIQDEQAELMKAYRLCLGKYEQDPPRAKEVCGPYTPMLRDAEVRQQHTR